MTHYDAASVRYSLLKYRDTLAVGSKTTFGTGQVYTLYAISETRNGEPLYHWSADCKKCGQRFTMLSGLILGGVNRHCTAHRDREQTPQNAYDAASVKGKVEKFMSMSHERREMLYALENKHTKDGVFDRQAYLKELRALDKPSADDLI